MSRNSDLMKFEFEKFYAAVNATRTARCASWRQVAREIGVGKSTLARMAQNKRPDADGLAALCYWAGINPADFVSPDPRSNGTHHDSDDCAHLPGALPA